MNATSDYLNLPCRTEAEVTLEACKRIRAAVENFKLNIANRINEVGGNAKWLTGSIDDGLDDAIGDVEKLARSAIEEAETRDEFEHDGIERRLSMLGSGVQFGRVA